MLLFSMIVHAHERIFKHTCNFVIESNLSRNYLLSGAAKMIGSAKFVVVYGIIICGPRLNSCPSLLFVSDHYSVLKIQDVTRSLELSDD